MTKLLSAKQTYGSPFEGIGTIGLEGGGDPVSGFASILSSTIGLLTVIAAIYFLYTLISGGISIMSAGGDKGAYEAARKKLSVGVIGMAVSISAIFLTDLVSWLLGIDNILDFGGMISQIAP